MQPVRIRFEKMGRASFISHLDLNRCMARALRRARIPVWYTQGFNPHAYIVFALPLSLFYRSTCESMDIRLDGEMPLSQVKDRLNAQMPEGLTVTEVYEPVMKHTLIAFSRYKIELEFDGKDAASLEEAVEKIRALERVLYEKVTKRGAREVDIKEYFHSAKMEISDGKILADTVLPSSQEENLNPACIVEAFGRFAGLTPDFDRVTRVAIYDEKMRDFR